MTSHGPAEAALHCVVRGRVQGVGFRMFVVQEARAAGVAGWVRNRDDGRSVELVAEGRREGLERLRRAVSAGPAGARVDDVACEWVQPGQGLRGFRVRR